MSEQGVEGVANACPFGCADLLTGEPTRVRLSNLDAPDDGWFCPDCWQPVPPPSATPPGSSVQ